MGRWMNKIKNKQYGQAMVEFALTIPVFLLLIFGVIEFSRFFLVYSSVFTASREATRFGTSVGEGDTENYLNCEAIAQRAVFSGSYGGVQINDVNIFYESTPGTIVASCPNVNNGTVPVSGNCHDGSITCDLDTPKYTPELGHRILVDIVTDFDSLLGIVPNLPVQATNGRTIMNDIRTDRTPIPYDLCNEHVKFKVSPPQQGETYTLLVEVENSSELASYSIYKIMNVKWNVTEIEEELHPRLTKVLWSDEAEPIWITDIEGGRLSDITIPDDGTINYWNQYLRNLGPKTTGTNNSETLEFEFNKDVIQSEINLTFDLIMQHTNLPTDLCYPVK